MFCWEMIPMSLQRRCLKFKKDGNTLTTQNLWWWRLFLILTSFPSTSQIMRGNNILCLIFLHQCDIIGDLDSRQQFREYTMYKGRKGLLQYGRTLCHVDWAMNLIWFLTKRSFYRSICSLQLRDFNIYLRQYQYTFFFTN